MRQRDLASWQGHARSRKSPPEAGHRPRVRAGVRSSARRAASQLRAAKVARSRGCPRAPLRHSPPLRHSFAALKLQGLGGAPGPPCVTAPPASQLRGAKVARSRGCPGPPLRHSPPCVTASRRSSCKVSGVPRGCAPPPAAAKVERSPSLLVVVGWLVGWLVGCCWITGEESRLRRAMKGDSGNVA